MTTQMTRKEQAMTRYYEAVIEPHYAGFGMYQQNNDLSDGWEDEGELLGEIFNNLAGPGFDGPYELGVDELPEGLEDIRGRTYDEEGRIFGWLEFDKHGDLYYVGYFAIVEREEPNE